MQREAHFGLDRQSIQNTTQASTRTQYFEHEVALTDPRTAAGVGSTAKLFADFFGLGAKGIEMMAEADHKRELVEIGYRNKDQKAQAEADVAEGRVPDYTQMKDRDYAVTYSITKAQSDAIHLRQAFDEQMSKLPFSENYDAHLQEFLKKEVGSGVEGDDYYNATLLGEFKKHTDAQRGMWLQNQQKETLLKAQENQAMVIGNSVQDGSLSGEKVDQFIDQAKNGPFIHNPTQAAPWVLSKIMETASSTNAQSIDRMLREGGYDRLFPQAYAEMTERLAGKFKGAVTAQGAAHWSKVHLAFDDPGVFADPGKMSNLLGMIEEGHSTYGNMAEYESAMGKFKSELVRISKETAGFNQYASKLQNPGQSYYWEPAEVNKYQFRYLQEKGIDPLASPEMAGAAAVVVAQNRSIASDLKANMTQALADTTNVAAQTNAFMFFKALESSGKLESLKSEIGNDAYTRYSMIKGLSGNDNSKVPAALAKITNDPSLLELPTNPEEIKWNELYDQPTKPSREFLGSALGEVRQNIAETLGGRKWFGLKQAVVAEDLVMTGTVEDGLLADYGRNLTLNKKAGLGNAKDQALKDTLAGIGGNYMLVPRSDGKFEVKEADLPKGAVVPTQKHMSMFSDDVKALSEKLPGIVPDGAATGLEVIRGPNGTNKTGLFALKRGTDPIVIAPGQVISSGEAPRDPLQGSDRHLNDTYKPGNGTVTLSKDPIEALAQLNGSLPKGMEATLWTVGGHTVLRLNYQFSNFESTVEEQKANFDSKHDLHKKDKTRAVEQGKKGALDVYSGGAFGPL